LLAELRRFVVIKHSSNIAQGPFKLLSGSRQNDNKSTRSKNEWTVPVPKISRTDRGNFWTFAP
jgi:hypothetical protein